MKRAGNLRQYGPEFSGQGQGISGTRIGVWLPRELAVFGSIKFANSTRASGGSFKIETPIAAFLERSSQTVSDAAKPSVTGTSS